MRDPTGEIRKGKFMYIFRNDYVMYFGRYDWIFLSIALTVLLTNVFFTGHITEENPVKVNPL